MDYCTEVLRRFRAPSRVGALPKGAPGVVAASAEDRSLNVWVRFEIQTHESTIADARFSVYGCPHTVAAADWVAERLLGRPTASLGDLDMQVVARALEIPREKAGKLLRIEDALARCAQQIEDRAKGSD